MREIETYDSVKSILEDLSYETKNQFKTALKQYLQFRNSQEGLTSEINPDFLIEEARENITFTQRQIDNFYLWLQGKKIEGYGRGFIFLKRGEKKPIRVKSSSAFVRTYSNLRGFYVNNDKGANAIVGLDIETSDVGSKDMSVMLISATGTAVVVKLE
jgi:hypothetical protein